MATLVLGARCGKSEGRSFIVNPSCRRRLTDDGGILSSTQLRVFCEGRLTLAPGLRLQVAPLTTALLVSARADPAIEALPDTAKQERLALAMAKAFARRTVLDWEGVGDDIGDVVPGRCWSTHA